jgi:hypothetical protein
MIDNSQLKTLNIAVIMYSSLMVSFEFIAPVHHIYAISSKSCLSKRYVPFHTSYVNDPWTLHSSNASCEGQSNEGMAMPLSTTKIVYKFVLDSSTNPNLVTSQTDEEDIVLYPIWATSSSFSHDFLDDNLPSDERIIEAMNGSKRPWDDMRHFFYFLLEIAKIEPDNFRSNLSKIVGHVIVPLNKNDIYVEGNMVSISPTITINISHTPDKIENVYISADYL